MPEDILLIESTKNAIKRIVKDLKENGGLSNYTMCMILESILCDYRSEASYDYITAQVAVNAGDQNDKESD